MYGKSLETCSAELWGSFRAQDLASHRRSPTSELRHHHNAVASATVAMTPLPIRSHRVAMLSIPSPKANLPAGGSVT